MDTLKNIIENNDTKWGRIFDLMIQSLIVLSLFTFSIETLPGLSETTRRWLRYVEIVTVFIFTGEYVLRLVVADRKIGFITSFFGVVDLLAILPFYIASIERVYDGGYHSIKSTTSRECFASLLCP